MEYISLISRRLSSSSRKLISLFGISWPKESISSLSEQRGLGIRKREESVGEIPGRHQKNGSTSWDHLHRGSQKGKDCREGGSKNWHPLHWHRRYQLQS